MSLTSSENQSEYLSNNNNQNYKNNSHNPIFIISVGPTGCGKSKTRDLVIKNFNLDIEVKDILEFSIDNVIEADKDYRIFLNLIFELYNNDTLIKKLVKKFKIVIKKTRKKTRSQ